MVAVAFLFFNRPELTRRSFESIRTLRPSDLFLISDGPRMDHPDDELLCEQTRAVVEDVQWPCRVRRLYADENLGIRRRISGGLDAVFAEVEKAIVLEDDCVSHPDFFPFCVELLNRYEEEQRVMTITGDNFQTNTSRGSASYYFSRYPHVWGWATWRRAWALYDVDMAFWHSWKTTDEWNDLLPGRARRYWESIFDRVVDGDIDTWAYQWLAANLYHGGLTATPNVNLVTNVGFGEDATHTRDPKSRAAVAVEPLGEMTHPAEIAPNEEADLFTLRNHFRGGSWLTRKARAIRDRLL